MLFLARTRTVQEGSTQWIKTFMFNSRALSKDVICHSLPGLLVNATSTG